MTAPQRNSSFALDGRKILILFPHMVFAGGALLYTLKLAEELVAEGGTVAIMALKVGDDAVSVPAGVEVISLNGPLTSSLWYWFLFPFWQGRINRAVTAWQPDLLVSQVFPSNWWGWLYKWRNPSVRLVWICHEPSAFIHSAELINGLRPFWKRWLAKMLQPLLRQVDLRLARQSDRVVANSLYTATQVERVYGKKCDGIARPGVDLELFHPDKVPREHALITVAHLVPYKRIDFLLLVFARLLKSRQNLSFHIVGEGVAARELQRLARDLGVADRVIFHGRLNHAEVGRLTRRMLLLLFAGVNETFGMAPLEAIASGTPVVAHCSGGPREFVNERCGLLIDSLRVEDWVEAVEAYLDELQAEPDIAEQVSACAREHSWQQSLRPAADIIAGLCASEKRQYNPSNM